MDRKTLAEILQAVPPELRNPLELFVEALHGEVRREVSAYLEEAAPWDASLRRVERRLLQSQRRTEERFSQLAEALAHLAEAQRRTEERVERLAEAQRRTEERLQRLEETVQALAEAQRRTEEELRAYREASEARFARIEAALEKLAKAQRRTEERLQRLEDLAAQQIQTLRDAIEALQKWQEVAENRIAAMDGFYLKYEYERKAPAILGWVLHKVRVVPHERLEDRVASLPRPELMEFFQTDLIVRGRLWDVPGEPEIWAAIEVSSVVDRNDVRRAVERANLLRKIGLIAVPIAAGRRATEGAVHLAPERGVVIITDGKSRFWRQALTAVGIELPPDWKAPDESESE